MLKLCQYGFVFLAVMMGIVFGVVQAKPLRIELCGQYEESPAKYSQARKLTGVLDEGSEFLLYLKNPYFKAGKRYMLVDGATDRFNIFEITDINYPSSVKAKEYVDDKGEKWLLKKGWDKCE